jgi:hypothetical protein
VTTTHALLAGKVQRKVSNGVASLAAAESSLDRPKIAAVPAPRRLTNIRARRAAEILALGPELRVLNGAAQTRMVSVARIRLHSGESARHFKGIFCDDISEFESDQLSHAVGSL